MQRLFTRALAAELGAWNPEVKPEALFCLLSRAEPLAHGVVLAQRLAPALGSRWRMVLDADNLSAARQARECGAFGFAPLGGQLTLLARGYRLAAARFSNGDAFRLLLNSALVTLRRAAATPPGVLPGRLQVTLGEGASRITARLVTLGTGAMPFVFFHGGHAAIPDRPAARRADRTQYAASLIMQVLAA